MPLVEFAMKTFPQKYTGQLTWLYSENSTFEQRSVPHAVLPSANVLAFDCDCRDSKGPYLYTVKLQRIAGDRFEGTFEAGKGTERHSTGSITAHVYESLEGILLRGQWLEGSYIIEYFAELTSDQAP